jgi:hypothetical protein
LESGTTIVSIALPCNSLTDHFNALQAFRTGCRAMLK